MVNWFLGKDIQQQPDNDSRRRPRRVSVVMIASVMLCVMGGLLIYHNWPSTKISAPNAASRWMAPPARMAMPDLVLFVNDDGRRLHTSQFYGRPMVVMFYTLDCRQCIESLRSLDTLAQVYRSRVDFFAVGLVRKPSTDLQSVRYLFREHDINVLTPYSIGQESAATIVSKSLPTTLVVNPDDQVVLIHHGPGNWNTKDVHRQLDQMVAGR